MPRKTGTTGGGTTSGGSFFVHASSTPPLSSSPAKTEGGNPLLLAETKMTEFEIPPSQHPRRESSGGNYHEVPKFINML